MNQLSLLIYRGILALLRALPFPLRSKLGTLTGRLIGHFPTRDQRIAKLQLKQFFPHENPPTVPDIFAQVGATFLESLDLSFILRQADKLVTVNQEDLLEKIRSSKTGTLVLSGHFGNWDLLASYAKLRGIPVVAIGKQAKKHVWQKLLEEQRERNNIETIWRSDSAGLKKILSELKAGKTIAVLSDQDTNVSSSFSTFFGREAYTPDTLVALAEKRGIPIYSAFLAREPNHRFNLDIRELDVTAGTRSILDQFHNHLEECIRKHPAQWVWFHKRWKTQKDGSRLRTAEYLRLLENL